MKMPLLNLQVQLVLNHPILIIIYARAQVFEKLLKYKEAKSDYEKAIVFNPKNVDAMISHGAVCNKTGGYEEALKLLNHATAIERRNTRVYPEKVITLIGLGEV